MQRSRRWAVKTRLLPAASVALVALGSTGVYAPATAHEENAFHGLAVLDEVAPAVPGIEVRVVHVTAPILTVRNTTTSILTIFGLDGEAFLRIGDDRVRANPDSPLTYASMDSTTAAVKEGTTDPAGQPWITLAEQDSWSWFDPRLQVEPEHLAGARWEVGAEIDGTRLAIRGSFERFEGHGHFRTIADDVSPRIDGLEVRLLPGAVPAIFVRNDTTRELAVPGRSGEPFLRVSSRGVFANLRSPSYYLGGRQTIHPLPPNADPTSPPVWKRVSHVPSWAWLEYRARLPARWNQRAVLGTERRTILRWQTPMRLGDEAVVLTGHVDWVPPRSLAGSDELPSTIDPRPILAAIAGAAFLITLVRVRSRRAR